MVNPKFDKLALFSVYCLILNFQGCKSLFFFAFMYGIYNVLAITYFIYIYLYGYTSGFNCVMTILSCLDKPSFQNFCDSVNSICLVLGKYRWFQGFEAGFGWLQIFSCNYRWFAILEVIVSYYNHFIITVHNKNLEKR